MQLLVDQAYYTMGDIQNDSPGRKHFSEHIRSRERGKTR